MSNLGFPEELNFQMLKSMYPSRKTEYRKAPMNSQSFNQAGTDIQLVLSKMENTFYDPGTLCVSFNVEYATDATGAAGTDDSYIFGNAYSHFSRQVIKPMSGQPIETIDNPSLLSNAILNMVMDTSEKIALSSLLGFSEEAYTNLGTKINKSNNLKTQSFNIPLIGILNTAKLIPAFITDIEIDLTLNNLSNFIFNGTAKVISGYTIRNVELVCESITLESSGMQQLMAMFPGVMKLKSSSYLYGASTLPSTAPAGTIDITYSHSLNSLKQFIWWSSPANAWEKNYGGVNPNLSGWQLLIGSTTYPQQPVKCTKVSECFYQNQKSFGSLYSTNHCGSSPKNCFAKASSENGEYLAYETATEVTTIGAATTYTNASKWYQCLDLEIINGLKESLYTGISTKGSTNTLRLNIGTPLAAQPHNVHFYSHFDVILEFDYINGVVNVIQ